MGLAGELTASPIFLTGGTGFIGSALVRALADRGESVRLFVRRPPNQVPAGVEVVRGDLLDGDSVRAAMDGCERVFHLAAHAKAGGPHETYRRINVDGTAHIVDAARVLGVRRLVFTSTSATLGPSGEGMNDESCIKDGPWFTPYEATKRLAEDVVLDSGLDAVIVHPSRVFGPGPLTQSNGVTKVIDWVRRGWFRFQLGDGGSVGNYVFVADVVAGHLAAMDRGRAGERYLLGGDNASFRELIDAIALACGRQHRVFAVPPALVGFGAGLEERRAEWMGGQPLISADHVERFLANYAFTTAKAQKHLDYRFVPLHDGIARTLIWLGGG